MKASTQSLILYLAVTFFAAFFTASNGLTTEVVSKFQPWDWLVFCFTIFSQVCITWKAFLNQSISRENSSSVNVEEKK